MQRGKAMDDRKIIQYIKDVELPEKFYEACVTCNIITYFKEKRDEIIYPFAVSQVREREEGYDFGYNMNDRMFLLQYKRPKKCEKMYRWDIDVDQLDVIVNNQYGDLTYYALPMFDEYRLWYKALEPSNIKFIDAITLKKYLELTGKKSINSGNEKLKDWEQVVYELLGINSYKSALAEDSKDYINELLRLLMIDGVIGYEIK